MRAEKEFWKVYGYSSFLFTIFFYSSSLEILYLLYPKVVRKSSVLSLKVAYCVDIHPTFGACTEVSRPPGMLLAAPRDAIVCMYILYCIGLCYSTLQHSFSRGSSIQHLPKRKAKKSKQKRKIPPKKKQILYCRKKYDYTRRSRYPRKVYNSSIPTVRYKSMLA
ncbi:hypothetical protein F5884DRAFT_189776 [Xylogone sp. PMI_703]|nr:hypothetical protein F5884DRAFT_189776 [Xylogone sp. PMI_703]